MPSIPIADKPTLDQVLAYVDTLETLIGTANPASGDLTTLFKGLKLIADYVDTLEAKLGLNTDAAGTSTVFARLAQIAGYTDQVEGFTDALESNLGTTGDAANASGTVLARLAELLNNRLTVTRVNKLDLIRSCKYFRFADYYNASSVDNQWYTVCDVSGAGRLFSVSFAPNNLEASIRVTIDGDIQTWTGLSSNSSRQWTPNNYSAVFVCDIEFTTNLKVEVKEWGTNNVLRAAVDFGLY